MTLTYTPKTNWQKDDIVTEHDLNRIEQGVSNVVDQSNNHNGDLNNPHNVTVNQIGAETPVGAQSKADTAEQNAKQYVDNHKSEVAPHGATSDALANKLVSRDSNGKIKLVGLLLSNGQNGFIELKVEDGKFGFEVNE